MKNARAESSTMSPAHDEGTFVSHSSADIASVGQRGPQSPQQLCPTLVDLVTVGYNRKMSRGGKPVAFACDILFFASFRSTVAKPSQLRIHFLTGTIIRGNGMRIENIRHGGVLTL